DLKYKDGQTKYILKKVLEKYIPRSLWDRPKHGFASPVYYWLRGELKPLVKEYLGEDRIKREGIFDPKTVSWWVNKFLKDKSLNFERIWYLLMFEMWKEKWVH
ncbi:MAG: asparagine synthetase B, partial [Candidatus Dadabacteria bacterium]|nr:asparagine synthetase B [Candidatus Dadabacteria bacterium]